MHVLERESDCRQLWEAWRTNGSYQSITDLFDFRLRYNEIFELEPQFITDDTLDPIVLAPLSRNKEGRYTWFGSNICEDQKFLYPSSDDNISIDLSSLDIHDLCNIGEKNIPAVQKGLPGADIQLCGVKIVSENGNHEQFFGSNHWSKRNIMRARNRCLEHDTRWQWCDITRDFLDDLFETSIQFYSQRNNESRFTNAAVRKRYEQLLLNTIPGMSARGIEIAISHTRAALGIILATYNHATAANLTIDAQHPNERIHDAIFRYCITEMPNKIREHMPNIEKVDFQGGQHSWKTQVSPSLQHPQYSIHLQ